MKTIVFVVDDDSSIRRALLRLLRSVGLDAEGFSTAAEFLERPPVNRPSCLLLDVRMPGMSGLELQGELERRSLDQPIVFLTGYGTLRLGVQAIKGGAVDFLEKPFEEEALLAAVAEGLQRSARARAARTHRDLLEEQHATLSPRERQVFGLVVSGLLNKQVAANLGISEKTVKVHRQRVMKKMKADSLAGLVRMAGELQLAIGA